MVRRRRGGFTLLEIMVVLAINAVVAALAVDAYMGIRAQSAPRTASHDLYSALMRAKARATERGTDVWFILYPNININGVAGAGGGAWFLIEDGDSNFTSGGTSNWTNFSPPTLTADSNDRILDFTYMDNYSGGNVLFSRPTGLSFAGPFVDLNATGNPVNVSGCSFCSGTPLRGAIVFSGDGSAHFVDAAGVSTMERIGGLAVRGGHVATAGALVAIAGATGFVSAFQ